MVYLTSFEKWDGFYGAPWVEDWGQLKLQLCAYSPNDVKVTFIKLM